jgi:hypothetical protein
LLVPQFPDFAQNRRIPDANFGCGTIAKVTLQCAAMFRCRTLPCLASPLFRVTSRTADIFSDDDLFDPTYSRRKSCRTMTSPDRRQRTTVFSSAADDLAHGVDSEPGRARRASFMHGHAPCDRAPSTTTSWPGHSWYLPRTGMPPAEPANDAGAPWPTSKPRIDIGDGGCAPAAPPHGRLPPGSAHAASPAGSRQSHYGQSRRCTAAALSATAIAIRQKYGNL